MHERRSNDAPHESGSPSLATLRLVHAAEPVSRCVLGAVSVGDVEGGMTPKQRKELNECVSVTVELDEDAVLGWVQDNLNPDEVFSTDELDGWAEKNGWVRP